MRRTALALFVVEPTHLRCEKLDLIQAKSKFRLEARVGGFSVGIAAGCIALRVRTPRRFDFLPELLCGEGCRVLLLARARAGSLRHGRICGQVKARSLTHCS